MIPPEIRMLKPYRFSDRPNVYQLDLDLYYKGEMEVTIVAKGLKTVFISVCVCVCVCVCVFFFSLFFFLFVCFFFLFLFQLVYYCSWIWCSDEASNYTS